MKEIPAVGQWTAPCLEPNVVRINKNRTLGHSRALFAALRKGSPLTRDVPITAVSAIRLGLSL